MATPEGQAQAPEEDPAGTFRLSPEEVDELEEADREYEADEAAGRTRPLSDLLAELRKRYARS